MRNHFGLKTKQNKTNTMTKKEWIAQLSDDDMRDIALETCEGNFPEEIKVDEAGKILNKDEAVDFLDDMITEYGLGFEQKKIAVYRTEARHTSVTYRSELELYEIRENNNITIMDMSDEDLIQAIEQDPSDYFDDLYGGEVVYDKSKDMGSYDEVTVE